MGVDEGNLQVIDVDVILESCPIPVVILNLLVHNSTIQYSTISIIVYDSKCHRTLFLMMLKTSAGRPLHLYSNL